MFKDLAKPAIVLFLICLITTGLLALVNGTTKPIIDEGVRQAKQDALAKVYSGVNEFSEPISADTLKQRGYQPTDRVLNVYEAKSGGNTVGYVVDIATRGYGGNISMLVAIDKELNIVNTAIMSHSETPGFGSKIVNGFMDQFQGNIPDNGYNVVKKPKSKDGDIQAITGATITSRAAVNGVNDAVSIVRELTGKGAK